MSIKQQIINAFQIEHREQLEGIRSILSSLEREATAPNDARWNEAFRMAHTLKGGARVCELRPIESLGHRMESLFAEVREGRVSFNQSIADTIYKVLDEIEDWMTALAAGAVPEGNLKTLELLEKLLQAVKSKSSELPVPEPESIVPETAPAPEELSTPAGLQDSTLMRVQTQHLDAVLRTADSLFELNSGQDQIAHELFRLSGQIRTLQRQCEVVFSTVNPAFRRMSAMPEFAGVERQVEGILQQVRNLGRNHRGVRASHQASAWKTRVASEQLRRAAEQTRLVSAESVFQGLGAMTRSIARDQGKEIEFRTNGFHVQADRRVLQSLKEVLIHALRNSVAHGIETPQERIEKGKNRAGLIHVSLQIAKNRLEIQIEDDGRGIDFNRIARTAVAKGFISQGSMESQESRHELTKILFRPGFSTVPAANELSGRGMGLSVIFETVTRLRGQLRMKPRDDHGISLEVNVPVFVSTERLLLVSSGGQTFAIPTASIEQLFRVPREEVQRIDDQHIVIVDGKPLSVFTLSQVLGLREGSSHESKLSVLSLRSGGQRIGLVVDSFLAEREAIIKELDQSLQKSRFFSGAIIMEDSEVALVVDVSQAATWSQSTPPASSPSRSQKSLRTPLILVVDDSFTTRTLEKSILETNGYDVRVAVNGEEALKLMRAESIDMVVSDVQMPKMDGLSLLREVRSDEKLRTLPLILVTSLDRPEDFERGMRLGANAYIVKRQFDHQELLSTIQRLLRESEVT